MIKNKSKQTYFTLEQEVKLDIIKKGWIVMDTPAETSYDLIVDLGLKNNTRSFVTIQVKTDLRTTSRRGTSGEPVSSNGISRNSYYYYDEDVTYLASKNKYGEIFYVHKNDYKKKTEKELKYANKSVFPINKNMTNYRKERNTSEIGTLESYCE